MRNKSDAAKQQPDHQFPTIEDDQASSAKAASIRISTGFVQRAKSWELRAAMSTARLWRDQRKPQQAHDLLAPIYDWFTEGSTHSILKKRKQCAMSCLETCCIYCTAVLEQRC